MYKNYPYFIVLTFISAIFVIITAQFLVYIPPEICAVLTYSVTPFDLLKPGQEEIKEEAIPVVAISEIKETVHNEHNYPISIQNDSGISIDLNELTKDYFPPVKKLSPQILIVHTHATESYIECDNRSLDETKNMVAVGKALKEQLESYGFSVIHNTTYHDYPNYNGSYTNSLKTIENSILENPDIDIVLDIHRDGIETEDGKKLSVKTDIDGVSYAKLMFVVGTNASGLYHPDWKENLKFSVGLQNVLMGFSESIVRPINIRQERFNQHTTKNSIIVEVGSNGNSLEEAIRSAKLLAKAISLYIRS